MKTSTEQTESVEEVIRLPSELPSGWEKSSLAQVAEIIMGQSPSSEYYNMEGSGLPFFQGKAEFGDLYPEAVKWCSAPGKIAQKDDVLISVRAPVGPTNLAPSECCIGRGLAAIRPRNGIPPKYILHYLRSIESDIDSLGTGTTFKAISGKTLREIPIPVAPPDQQKRIVAEIEKQFSRLDEAVANLKRVKANLKRYKAAVLKAAVEGRLVETEAERARREGRSFETGAELLQRILETRRSQWQGKGKYKEPAAADTTTLPELPEGWVWATIGQVAECIDSMRVPVNKKERLNRVGDVPYYGANGRVGFIDDYIFNEPLVLVVEDETFTGRELPFSYKIAGKSWVNNHAHVLRPTDMVTLDYLNYALSFYPFTPLTTGTTGRKKLTQLALVTAPLGIPPKAEQQRIVAEVDRRLSLSEEAEAQVDANLKRTQVLRGAVLSNAFQNKQI